MLEGFVGGLTSGAMVCAFLAFVVYLYVYTPFFQVLELSYHLVI